MKAFAAFLQGMCFLALSHAWTCTVPPQQYPAKQIDAGLGMVVMTDEQNRTYAFSGLVWQNLGTVQLKHVSVGAAGIWGVDGSDKVYKYVDGDFVPSQGQSMQQVDAGGAGEVVGTSLSSPFCLTSTQASAYSKNGLLTWASLSANLTYISCSPLYGCWGIDSTGRVYVAQTITPSTCSTSGWSRTNGLGKIVEVGTDGNVFVLTSVGEVWQRTGNSSVNPQGITWIQIPMSTTIKHLTYDLGNLWVITDGSVIMKCSQ